MSLAGAAEHLYARAVTEPERLLDEAIADWSADLPFPGGAPSREAARAVRRVIRVATKLRTHWRRELESSDGWSETRRALLDDWRSRVDEAGGIPAWRPVLDLAVIDLEERRDETSFDRVVALFRVVNGVPFLDGCSYEEWTEGREP